MTTDSNEKKEYPWESQRTVLRDVDLRGFSQRPRNLKLALLWKSGGQSVIALLRTEMLKSRKLESKAEADTET